MTKKVTPLLFSKLIIIIFGITVLFSCKKQDESRNKLKSEFFDCVGNAHNEALDYIFNNTFATNQSTSITDVKRVSAKFFFTIHPIVSSTKDDIHLIDNNVFEEDI